MKHLELEFKVGKPTLIAVASCAGAERGVFCLFVQTVRLHCSAFKVEKPTGLKKSRGFVFLFQPTNKRSV